jgi:hypothetical protein
MNIEVEVPVEGNRIPVLSMDNTCFEEWADSHTASLGVKEFSDTPGQFTYSWVASYLTLDDLLSLQEAVGFMVKQMTDANAAHKKEKK